MNFNIKKATKEKSKLRLALHGPSGSGKTYTALNIAKHMGGRSVLADTERGSARKYGDKFDFDVLELPGDCDPEQIPPMLDHFVSEGYNVAIIDSLTHFWNGTGGFLEKVDAEVKRQKARGNKPDSFSAWKEVDPIYKRMVHALLSAPIHIIMTMRAKMEYAREEEGGRTKIRKVGLAPEMRDQFSYEADIEGMLDLEHNLVIGKTRCDAIDGKVFTRPGADVARILLEWLEDGATAAPSLADELVAAAGQSVNAESLDLVKAHAKTGWKTLSKPDQVRVTKAIEDSTKALSDVVQHEAAQ